MSRMFLCAVVIAQLGLWPVSVSAQDEISSIPFEPIPGEISFATGAGEAIELQSNTAVTGDLSATREVLTHVGIRFPDGTLQTTAKDTGA